MKRIAALVLCLIMTAAVLGAVAESDKDAVVAKGRAESINGVSVPWLAQRMLERGAKEALNLDGGGTACLMFMGQPLNRKNINQLRVVPSITGAGQSEQVPEK